MSDLESLAFKDDHKDIAEWKAKAKGKVGRKQINQAISALIKHDRITKEKSEKDGKKKQTLFDDEDSIDFEVDPIETNHEKLFSLVFGIKSLSAKTTHSLKGYPIPLPNPLIVPNTALKVCIIVQSKEEKKAIQSLLSLLPDSPVVASIKKIIDIKKVRALCPTPEQRKDYSVLYDVFLADWRVIGGVPKTLGKYFCKGQKQVIPVKLTSPALEKAKNAASNGQPAKKTSLAEIEENITSAIQCSYFHPRGACCPVKVGRLGCKSKEIAANVEEALAYVGKYVENGWDNIVSIGLKTGNSVTLPLYASTPTEESLEKDDDFDEEDFKTKRVFKRFEKMKQNKRMKTKRNTVPQLTETE